MPDAYWLIFAWLCVMGGAVGSFLNVVVYRLPNGVSLITPPSHCPACKQPIRWFDNVPVFGWIMLGGRCRNCRSPISIRYPLVEAVTAAMFGGLALVENPLSVAYGCHLVWLCTLLCGVLIAIDRKRPPLRLFIPALVAGVVWIVAWAKHVL
jgi:leader peptidase (prepilin peptidase) / N-methyltransferase